MSGRDFDNIPNFSDNDLGFVQINNLAFIFSE